eukprot:6485523-Karenia_brevis.AAC.1
MLGAAILSRTCSALPLCQLPLRSVLVPRRRSPVSKQGPPRLQFTEALGGPRTEAPPPEAPS